MSPVYHIALRMPYVITIMTTLVCEVQRWSLVTLQFRSYVKGRQFDRIVDILFGDLQVLRTT